MYSMSVSRKKRCPPPRKSPAVEETVGTLGERIGRTLYAKTGKKKRQRVRKLPIKGRRPQDKTKPLDTMPRRMRRVLIEPRAVQNTFNPTLDAIQFPSAAACDRLMTKYLDRMDSWLAEAEKWRRVGRIALLQMQQDANHPALNMPIEGVAHDFAGAVGVNIPDHFLHVENNVSQLMMREWVTLGLDPATQWPSNWTGLGDLTVAGLLIPHVPNVTAAQAVRVMRRRNETYISQVNRCLGYANRARIIALGFYVRHRGWPVQGTILEVILRHGETHRQTMDEENDAFVAWNKWGDEVQSLANGQMYQGPIPQYGNWCNVAAHPNLP